ncbi:MAG: F0F1 ATP synthase subunit B [Bacteroidales bacterium]|jgi:F-type H+-transporting ATPase subunit b
MELINPGVGLIFWTGLVFLILLLILSKFAWKPIINTIKKRNESIQKALDDADEARQELAGLDEKQKAMVEASRKEKHSILEEAKSMREQMLSDTEKETQKMVENMKSEAKDAIEKQKNEAMREIKNMVSELSVDIAEKILKQELENKEKHNKLVDKLLDDVKLN